MTESADRDLLEEARPAEGMSLADLAREIPGSSAVVEGDASVLVTGVHHDSRQVQPGDLFVVRRGEKYDGSSFVADAVARGAVAVLAERHEGPTSVQAPPERTVPILRVADVATGLAYTSAAVYGHPAFSLDVIGITGTNGKTTTSHLVRAAIDGALGLPKCGIVGTIGHSYAGKTIAAAHTTPEADELARVLAVMRKRGATHVAMEVSSIALMLGRVKAVRFRVAAFTNLTQDHLDFHGSMEAYAAAKMHLFTTCEPGLAVVNVDQPFGVKVAAAAKCRVLRVKTSLGTAAGDADIAPLSVDASASGMRITARVPGGDVEIKTRLVGLHNLENLLVAIGVASALDLEVERAAKALEFEIGAPGRLERCDGPGDDIVVLVDYAHTPDALARVLDAVREVSRPLDEAGGSRVIAPRVMCVFGCGGDRDPTKRKPMGEAVGARVEVAIVTSDNPRTEAPEAIAEPVEEGVRATGLTRLAPQEVATARRGYVVELDRQRAIALAIEAARPGDVVLVAGKGHEDYQIVGTTKRPFDDRLESRRALEARRARVAASDSGDRG
ncbi:MAG: UDP-N-acetylmuramoylalanyl-D-glutamate--2,6-diaminopimelate ligase [Myxococcaceae bacterium]|nr:UDP-N-acetylmuramoylalanyl-D-glutamate--2,6-diaminopimelate ligase [Myxococcaceae bacterium]